MLWASARAGEIARKALDIERKAIDIQARLMISKELGYERFQIVVTYIGV